MHINSVTAAPCRRYNSDLQNLVTVGCLALSAVRSLRKMLCPTMIVVRRPSIETDQPSVNHLTFQHIRHHRPKSSISSSFEYDMASSADALVTSRDLTSAARVIDSPVAGGGLMTSPVMQVERGGWDGRRAASVDCGRSADGPEVEGGHVTVTGSSPDIESVQSSPSTGRKHRSWLRKVLREFHQDVVTLLCLWRLELCTELCCRDTAGWVGRGIR